ncbi:hypothetical protein [Enterococcus phage PEF7b]
MSQSYHVLDGMSIPFLTAITKKFQRRLKGVFRL